MRAKHTIIINGRHYDAITGLAIDTHEVQTVHVKTNQSQPVSAVEAPAAATNVEHTSPVHPEVSRVRVNHLHTHPTKSQTLRRDVVSKPAGAHDKAAKHIQVHHAVPKSPHITKFAPHPEAVATQRQAKAVVMQHTTPAVVAASHHKAAVTHAASKPVAMSSRELKDHLIKQRLSSAPTKHAPHKPAKRQRAPLRVSSVMAACLGIMVLGGYLSYINMPNLSVRVAASQSGVDAQYPGYTPSGYRFDGPVAFSNGRVSLNFAANGGNARYEINQQKTAWDSQAVLDNYVVANSKNYEVNDTQGLTVYTYGNNAAWVNRGVLYTISGDAPLRTEQVLRIATSL